jgi:hypothetical protein
MSNDYFSPFKAKAVPHSEVSPATRFVALEAVRAIKLSSLVCDFGRERANPRTY